MKTTVTLCLDIEVAAMLAREKNKSSLINSYLINYYDMKGTRADAHELEQKKKKAKEELAIVETQIEQVEKQKDEDYGIPVDL